MINTEMANFEANNLINSQVALISLPDINRMKSNIFPLREVNRFTVIKFCDEDMIECLSS